MLLNIGKPLSLAEFDAAKIAPVGGYEVNEDVIYDTVTYPQAGVANGGTLDVFTIQSNDETITNLRQPGQIPKPDRFHAKKLFLVPLVEQTVDADLSASNIVRDLDRVLVTNRGFLKLTPSTTGRSRGPIPLDAIGSMGGVIVESQGNNAPAAGASAVKSHVRTANTGGYPFDLLLDSGEEIKGTMKFGNGQALSAAMMLRVVLYGFRYKKAG